METKEFFSLFASEDLWYQRTLFCYLNKLDLPAAICSLVTFFLTNQIPRKNLVNEICSHVMIRFRSFPSTVLLTEELYNNDITFFSFLKQCYPEDIFLWNEETQYEVKKLEKKEFLAAQKENAFEILEDADALEIPEQINEENLFESLPIFKEDPIFQYIAISATNQPSLEMILKWKQLLPRPLIYLSIAYYLRFHDINNQNFIELNTFILHQSEALLSEFEVLEPSTCPTLQIIRRIIASSHNELAYAGHVRKLKMFHYRLAAELDPTCAIYLFNKATTYMEHCSRKSLIYYNQAIEQSPYNFSSYFLKFNIHMQSHEYSKAYLTILNGVMVAEKAIAEQIRLKQHASKIERKMSITKFIAPSYQITQMKPKLLQAYYALDELYLGNRLLATNSFRVPPNFLTHQLHDLDTLEWYFTHN